MTSGFGGRRRWRDGAGLLLLAAMRLAGSLPRALQYRLGGVMGRLAQRLARRRCAIARTNLALCFPECDDDAREAMLAAHWRSVGRAFFETGLAWWGSSQRVGPWLQLRGLEHLRQAQAQGGVLLLTGHFTTMEIGTRALCEAGVAFHVMQRPDSNPLLARRVRALRQAHSRRPVIDREQLRTVVRTLRAGETVWYAPDQGLSRDHVFAPFFGVATATLTATARLAAVGRAQVVPFFPRRQGRGVVVEILPALRDFPSGDAAADAARINAVLEAGVRQAAPDYFWLHRRFKQRPPGAPPLYPTAAADGRAGRR